MTRHKKSATRAAKAARAAARAATAANEAMAPKPALSHSVATEHKGTITRKPVPLRKTKKGKPHVKKMNPAAHPSPIKPLRDFLPPPRGFDWLRNPRYRCATAIRKKLSIDGVEFRNIRVTLPDTESTWSSDDHPIIVAFQAFGRQWLMVLPPPPKRAMGGCDDWKEIVSHMAHSSTTTYGPIRTTTAVAIVLLDAFAVMGRILSSEATTGIHPAVLLSSFAFSGPHSFDTYAFLIANTVVAAMQDMGIATKAPHPSNPPPPSTNTDPFWCSIYADISFPLFGLSAAAEREDSDFVPPDTPEPQPMDDTPPAPASEPNRRPVPEPAPEPTHPSSPVYAHSDDDVFHGDTRPFCPSSPVYPDSETYAPVRRPRSPVYPKSEPYAPVRRPSSPLYPKSEPYAPEHRPNGIDSDSDGDDMHTHNTPTKRPKRIYNPFRVPRHML